jgi:hypothetical protein
MQISRISFYLEGISREITGGTAGDFDKEKGLFFGEKVCCWSL